MDIFNPQTELRAVALGLLQQAGLDNLPSDTRDAYLDRMALQMQEAMGAALLQAMNEEGAVALVATMNDDGQMNTPQAQAVLDKYLPNASEVIRQAINSYSQVFLAGGAK